MVKNVCGVVPQCTFLILSPSEGFNMQVVDLQIFHPQPLNMMFSVRCNIDSRQFVVAAAD